MDLKLLIDGIVRQTTVLLAQLSTTAGVRAPLAHVADQVFLELAREIEAQGVRRQVAADMFGLALRSYQRKVQRLTESATVRHKTLWEAVLDFIDAEQPSRARVLSRFSRDGEREVAAVLNDLLRSGLVFVTGAGESAVYGSTPESMRDKVQRQHDRDSLANVAWLRVFRGEASTRAELTSLLGADGAAVDLAVDDLLQSGRLIEGEAGQLRSRSLVVPLGAEQSPALADHRHPSRSPPAAAEARDRARVLRSHFEVPLLRDARGGAPGRRACAGDERRLRRPSGSPPARRTSSIARAALTGRAPHSPCKSSRAWSAR
jgi:hypothetical protein